MWTAPYRASPPTWRLRSHGLHHWRNIAPGWAIYFLIAQHILTSSRHNQQLQWQPQSQYGTCCQRFPTPPHLCHYCDPSTTIDAVDVAFHSMHSTLLNIVHTALGLHLHCHHGHSSPTTITVIHVIHTSIALGAIGAVLLHFHHYQLTLAQLTASTAVNVVDPSHLYLCRYGVVAAAAHRPHLSFPLTQFHMHSGLSTPTSFTTDDMAVDNAYTPFAVVNFNVAWHLTPLLAVDVAFPTLLHRR